MMMGAGAQRKPPFSYSGTFASTLDGWTASGSAVQANDPSKSYRTNPGWVQIVSSNGAIEYTVPKATCGGLTIAASIWHKMSGLSSTTRKLLYKIGSGSFVELASVTDTATSYAQMSGTFDNPGDNDVTIRVEATVSFITTVYLDDWAISGS